MGINVLSLFDGISCGQVALERAGVKVDNYFASEIDQDAIQVTMSNYPNTIQLGDVKKVKAADLPQIDLVMGGSPCQGFSVCGAQKKFDDDRSMLFFEFARLVKECNPFYFFLENVVMDTFSKNIISGTMGGIDPLLLDSQLVSAQRRRRLYWTNIPNIIIPKDKGLVLKDVLESNVDKEWAAQGWVLKSIAKGTYNMYGVVDVKDKCRTLMAQFKKNGPNIYLIDPQTNVLRNVTAIEQERLQTLPDNYTSILPKVDARYKGIGNGWTVDIISHMFRFMNFETRLETNRIDKFLA